MNTSRTGIPERERVSANQILPLENGDRLSRQEFERRYAAIASVQES